MAKDSKIEWCDHTFNPWRGCTKVHEGCANCYAAAMSKRNPQVLGTWGNDGTRVVGAEGYWTAPETWNARAAALGERHRVFCASLADVFEDWGGQMVGTTGDPMWRCNCGHWFSRGEQVGSCKKCGDLRFHALALNDARRRLFALIDATPHLDWLLLTKRPENIRMMWHPPSLIDECEETENVVMPIRRPNVWLGLSVSLDRHIPDIVQLHSCRDLAPVQFLSCEPLLGELHIPQVWMRDESIRRWVIAGGESGPHARPMHPDWVRSLRDQCQTAGVPFFMKQMGGKKKPFADIPQDLLVRRFPEVCNA